MSQTGIADNLRIREHQACLLGQFIRHRFDRSVLHFHAYIISCPGIWHESQHTGHERNEAIKFFHYITGYYFSSGKII
jgi:hypothetical protein